jgi:hypothetical protein
MFVFFLKAKNSHENHSILFCLLNELAWLWLKNLQQYSVLLLSAYRQIACFNRSLFNRINSSKFLIILSIFLIWIFSFLIAAIVKFSIKQLGFGRINCFFLYSTHEMIVYLIVCSITTLAPLTGALAFFIMTYRKMNENESDMVQNKTQKHQLLFLNLCYLLSFVAAFCLEMSLVLESDDSDVFFSYFFQIINIIFILLFILTPLISLYYSPFFATRNTQTNFQSIQIAYFKNTVTFHFIRQ